MIQVRYLLSQTVAWCRVECQPPAQLPTHTALMSCNLILTMQRMPYPCLQLVLPIIHHRPDSNRRRNQNQSVTAQSLCGMCRVIHPCHLQIVIRPDCHQIMTISRYSPDQMTALHHHCQYTLTMSFFVMDLAETFNMIGSDTLDIYKQ